MRTIDIYCDEAIYRNNLKSDAGLSRALNYKGNTVSNFRTKRTWPSDATMIKLAELAGIPAEEAILDLGIWRATTPDVTHAYEILIERLSKSAAIILIAFLFSLSSSTTHAAGEQINNTQFKICIMRQL